VSIVAPPGHLFIDVTDSLRRADEVDPEAVAAVRLTGPTRT
jgi:hypothetical protein